MRLWKAIVIVIICGRTDDDAEVLSAALIIVLRLRNNLFHGVKWSYGIKGQLENFRNANNLLMSVIELHKTFKAEQETFRRMD